MQDKLFFFFPESQTPLNTEGAGTGGKGDSKL